MNRPDSPSAVLFKQLKSEIVPTEWDLASLARLNRIRLPDEGMTARVIEINYPAISYVSLGASGDEINNEAAEKVVTPVQVGFTGASRAWVRTTTPDRIALMAYDIAHVNFAPTDPHLDLVLDKGLQEFPEIKNLTHLKNLTSWVRSNIAQGSFDDPPKDDKLPVGEYVSKFGAVCRHYSAIELALLKLRGVRTRAMVMDVYHLSGESFKVHGQEKKYIGHMHLDVDIERSSESIIADPSMNLCGTSDELWQVYRKKDYGITNRFGVELSGIWSGG